MMYRVSQRTIFRNINTNLGFLTYDMAKINNQIATTKKVNKPSDDPTGGATILAMRSVLSDITQYNKDVALADDWLKQTESVLENMKMLVERADVLAEQMSTDTYKPENMDTAADEIQMLIEGLIQLGNSRVGDRYIFAGSQTEDLPFHELLEILDPVKDLSNSSSYTGLAKAPPDTSYDARPDLPATSQNYLIEVVNNGGVGVQTQATYNTTFTGGGQIRFTATDDYAGSEGNNIRIEYDYAPVPALTAAEPARATVMGQSPPDQETLIRVEVSAATTMNDIVNALNNDVRNTTLDAYPVPASQFVMASIATAGTVGGAPQATGGSLSGGTVYSASYARTTADPLGENNAIFYEALAPGDAGNDIRIDYVKNVPYAVPLITTTAGPPDVITVNLVSDGTGEVLTTADEVIKAINNDAVAGTWVKASLPPAGAGSGAIKVSGGAPATQSFQLSGGYDGVARLDIGQAGSDNGVSFTANVPDYAGTAGNLISVNYIDPGAANPATTSNTVDLGGGRYRIDVTLTHDGANITATANEVIAAIAADVSGPPSAGDLVTATVYPGDTGAGVVQATEVPMSLDGGALSPGAMYRVSLDGGQTWSTKLFDAAETMDPETIFNDVLGHASTTTVTPGQGNDLYIVAQDCGVSGQDISVEFVDDGPNTQLSVNLDPDDPFNIVVHLGTDALGRYTSTANDVAEAINNSPDPAINRMVHADLPDYREGGNGIVQPTDKTFLSGADPYVTNLGHATLTTDFEYNAPDENPNVVFTAIPHGELGPGSDIKIQYVAGTTAGIVVDAPVHVTTPEDYYQVTINLQTDTDGNIISTAQDVTRAVNQYHFNHPDALVTANLPNYPDGGGVVQEMDPTKLTGGDDDIEIDNYGAKIRFEGDGSALKVGDRFMIDVSYYHGDNEDIEVNSNFNTRVKINVTGEEALGAVGADDNILDRLARLKFALESHDSVAVADQLPGVNEALENLSSEMARVGVRMVRNQFTYNVLDSNEYNSTERMSQVEDLDIAEAIANLQIKQTAYQASLASTSLITKLSLADYIS